MPTLAFELHLAELKRRPGKRKTNGQLIFELYLAELKRGTIMM